MDFFQILKSMVGDSFLVLPLLLIGFSFFMGLLTSNIGLLLLFLGQLLLVPSLQFVLNEQTPLFSLDFFSGTKTFFSLLAILLVNGLPFSSSGSYLYSLFALFLFLFHRSNQVDYKEKGSSPMCSLVPNVSPDSHIYNAPSSWMAQILFFFSFIIANAFAIYNEPTPDLLTVSKEEKQKRQAYLDTRVKNRKIVSTAIIGISLITLLVIIAFRYKNTGCESSSYFPFLGMLGISMTGASFFNILSTYCGVRPVDILGIVQGLLPPDLIDNPIVCVGAK